MNKRDESFFIKRLSFLMRAGMPLRDALTLLATQAKGSPDKRAIAEVVERVEAGQPLAESLQTARLVSTFSIAVISVGEASGSLSENLAYAAEELQKASMLRSRVLGALIYPALIACATVALTAGLILFIFPKILPVFEGLQVSLPISTRIVLAVNWYLTHWGLATLASIVIIGIAFLIAHRRSPELRVWTEALLGYMPLVGTLLHAYALSTLARILALLLRSGMPLREALVRAASVVASERYQRELTALAGAIEEGTDLASRLRTNRSLFPDLVSQMVEVGESSGSLIENLEYLAGYYASEVEEQTRLLSSLAEPVLMIAMGCIVGFVAISMITPMYEITQHLNQR